MSGTAKILRSSSLFRVILILAVCGTVYCFNRDMQNSRPLFSFQSTDQIKKEVVEVGKIKYKNGKSLDLRNSYNSLESRINSNNMITLKGTISGTVDEALKPFLDGSSYTSEIDLGTADTGGFNPLYPVALRKLFYFMPKTELFDQKKWEIKAAGGEFPCSYTLRLAESVRSVDIQCSGKIKESSVILTGRVELNTTFSGFTRSDLDITAENALLSSNWKLSETINEPEAEGSAGDQTGFAIFNQ